MSLITGLQRRASHIVSRARNATTNILLYGNVHGEKIQHPADFLAYVRRQGGRQNSGFPDKWRVDPQFKIDNPSRVAVVLHVYYVDLLPELLQHLLNIPVEFDLIVTNASGESIDRPSNVGPLCKNVVVVEVANHGRDIFPLVQLVNSGILDPYELILKLHTKKSEWRQSHSDLSGSGEEWKNLFLSDLVGTREQVERILNEFAMDTGLGLMTATDAIVGSQFWGGDKRIVEELLLRLELQLNDLSELEFASGSMYWVRGFVLQGLRALNLQAVDFDEEAGQVDGTTAHAVERILGLLTKEAGLTLAEVGILERNIAGNQHETYQRFTLEAARKPKAKVVPFYLPQFHDSAENNEWWGEGFTEWTNVTSAIPAYLGHYQPRIPTELGFYDLELDSVRTKQAVLAREHGISAFMYYYYWFSGKRLLHRPIEKLLEQKDLDFPYCIMWANENWTRRWDGREADILIGQDYDKVPAEDFIDDVMEFLRDPRYLRVDGKALLAVYRPGQMKNFPEVVREWRERARKAGVGELYVLSVAVAKEFDALEGSFEDNGIDGTLQFPPHNLPWVAGPALKAVLDYRWRGNFMSFNETAKASLAALPSLQDNEYPGAMVTFDNTARRQWKADTWYGSNPYTFHRWVQGLVNGVLPREEKDRIVFINAWNEWAEGAILEPTTRWGRTYLQAIRNVLYS